MSMIVIDIRKENILNLLRYIKKYSWLILCCATPPIVCYGWEWLEVLMYGESEHRFVDGIIAVILVVSIILNIILSSVFSDHKKAIKQSKQVYRQIYMSAYHTCDTAISSLRTLNSNLKVADMILSETIKNESGEESKCVMKYSDIQSFATYLKCMNDLNMNYIKEQLDLIMNMNKEEKES